MQRLPGGAGPWASQASSASSFPGCPGPVAHWAAQTPTPADLQGRALALPSPVCPEWLLLPHDPLPGLPQFPIAVER